MPHDAIRTVALRKVYHAPPARRGASRWGSGSRAAGMPAPASLPPAASIALGEGGRGGEIVALAGLDLVVHEGEFFGLLGPNGAGKTTTIGILTTRVKPTAGAATVAGADVRTEEVAVRQRIGVVPQRPNPDRGLDVRENLVFHAAYFGIPRAVAARRAEALLDQFGLGDRGGSRVDELSGGQRQRLMIARALIHEPRVIFLDEPTVGLDPQARLALWEILRALHADGRTIVMTTHYMEEADRLCDRIAIVDRGELLALDTPAALKTRAPGGTIVELELDGPADAVLPALRALGGAERAEAARATLRVHAERGGELIPALIRAAQDGGRQVRDIKLYPPSLETLFISLTGRKLD